MLNGKTHTDMETLTLNYVTGQQKTFNVLAEGFIVDSYINGAGRTAVSIGKINVNDGNAQNVKFMSDIFVVERDMDNLSEIKEMLEFEGFNLSAEIVNNYMKTL